MVGWASVPYDPRWAYDNPHSSAKMAAAGPAANLLLVILAGIAIRTGIAAGVFVAPDSVSFIHVIDAAESGVFDTVASFLDVFFSLNLILFVFNLLPLPPLDGSGIFAWFLSKECARRYFDFVHNPSFSLIGIIVAWNLFEYVYNPIHLAVINMLFFGNAHYS